VKGGCTISFIGMVLKAKPLISAAFTAADALTSMQPGSLPDRMWRRFPGAVGRCHAERAARAVDLHRRRAVDQSRSWTWNEFTAMSREMVTVSMHSVTKWWKLGTEWNRRDRRQQESARRAAARGAADRRADLPRRAVRDEHPRADRQTLEDFEAGRLENIPPTSSPPRTPRGARDARRPYSTR
jgi:hypothetical protein